ncbi:MAG: indole-3-glycerol phosphate synthase TrpC [Deltaproteobacteria bacterium]|nr:indole-3-glycerol phosphate synthase TrpC [Deltaproteobacteria bacterium]
MHSRLKEILAEKEREVERLKREGLTGKAEGRLLPVRDFKGALSAPGRINLIAEIKSASPSAGVIRENVDPLSVGRMYEDAGAAAISLLTDHQFFGGDLKNLPILKEAVSLPILRKDFILDEIQIEESSLWGADAILLIARILTKKEMTKFLELCRTFGMATLTEIHDRDDLDKALECGAEIIGINNRDLDTFEINLNTTLELAPRIPEGRVKVSESGIKRGEDVHPLKQVGIQAILVGTSLMQSHDIGGKVRELAGL